MFTVTGVKRLWSTNWAVWGSLRVVDIMSPARRTLNYDRRGPRERQRRMSERLFRSYPRGRIALDDPAMCLVRGEAHYQRSHSFNGNPTQPGYYTPTGAP